MSCELWMGLCDIGELERHVKCRGEVHAKELCVEGSDQDVGRGVGVQRKVKATSELSNKLSSNLYRGYEVGCQP